MARIKYQPSTKVRGFNPIQISKEGITQLRNENNRVIQGLKNNFEAERAQQARDRAAMEENADLEQDRIKRDREIQLENLKNEQISLSKQAQVERQQAKFDAEAKSTFYNTLVDFSKTAISKAAENHANMITDQTEIANSKDITELIERVKNYDKVEQTQIQGGIALDTEIQSDSLESGEKRLDTLRALISNPALGDVQNRVIQNRVLKEAFPLMVGDALKSTEAIYDDGAGNKFSGIEAQRDPTKMGIVTSQVERTLRKRLGVDLAEPGRFTDALKSVQEQKTALQNQANRKGIEDNEDVVRQQAADLASDNTTKGYTLGFHKIKMIDGKEAAHDFTQKQGAKLGTDLEAIDRMDLLGDGRRYSEVWPNRWVAGLAKRQVNETKAIKANLAFKKAQLQQFEAENVDLIRQSYVENFEQARKATLQRSYESGLPPSELMKSIERSVMGDLEKQEEENLLKQIKFSSLDEAYVNSIQNPTVKTQAMQALAKQEEEKYGPAALGIKKGFKATARTLTDINPSEATGSPQTFLVQARLEKEFAKQLAITQDPVAANAAVNKMVDDAAKGDTSSPFYSKTGENNRLVFTNIETVDKELAEKNLMIDKNMKTFNADVASQAFLLATADEMDATIVSAQSNKVSYPKGVLRVAAAFGLKPSEVFNQQRKANNLVTGENKPLLTSSIGTKVVDGLSPANREVYMRSQEFRSTKMARRVASGIDGTIPNYVRGSMGGLNQSFNSDSIPSGYGSVIFDAASRNGIPPSILAGLIATESAFNPNAVSPAGARGLGQFMPPTAAEFDVNVNDPVSSIDGAARYLRYLTDYFKGDLEKAIYAYNGGMGNIEKFNGPIPGNQENQEYFNKVITNSNRYK